MKARRKEYSQCLEVKAKAKQYRNQSEVKARTKRIQKIYSDLPKQKASRKVYSLCPERYMFYCLVKRLRKKLTRINQQDLIKLFQNKTIHKVNNNIKVNIGLSRYVFRIQVIILPNLE